MKRILALILAFSLLCMPALGDETGGMLEKAEAFVAAGDLESAYICLDIAQQLSPDGPAVLRGFARLFAAGANYESALDSSKKRWHWLPPTARCISKRRVCSTSRTI